MDKRHKITREKAIQILSTRDAHGVLCGYTSGVTEALDMAIEALRHEEAEEKEYCHRIKPKDDTKVRWRETPDFIGALPVRQREGE